MLNISEKKSFKLKKNELGPPEIFPSTLNTIKGHGEGVPNAIVETMTIPAEDNNSQAKESFGKIKVYWIDTDFIKDS